ncbi:MAG: hypothetical protein NZ611_01840 [Bacteroidia bacterium]|nr:hypothetical protein [Bacteroidia bacterium]
MIKRRLGVFILGVGIGMLHFIIKVYVERGWNDNYLYIEDALCSIRQAANLIYCGSLNQQIRPSHIPQIPPEVWQIVEKNNSGACSPPYGCYFGRTILIGIPFVLIVDGLNLTSKQAARLYTLMIGFYAVVNTGLIFLLLHILLYPTHKLIYYAGLGGLCIIPFYSGYFTLSHQIVFTLSLITMSIQNSAVYSCLSVLLSIFSYFTDWKNMPYALSVPFIWLIANGKRKLYLPIFFFVVWSIVQVSWSLFIYSHTCRWAIASTHTSFRYYSCDGYREMCYNTKEYFDYLSAKMLDLQAFFGLPHGNQPHNKSLSTCISLHVNKKEEKTILTCDLQFPYLPEWAFSEEFSIDEWQRTLHLIGIAMDTELPDSLIIRYSKLACQNIDKLMAAVKRQAYIRLLLYRWSNVIFYNMFHYIHYIKTLKDPALSRDRLPKWTKVLYFRYAQVFLPLIHSVGLVLSLVLIYLVIARKVSSHETLIALLLLSGTWGYLIPPLLTGHSEWRYFFHTQIMLIIVSAYAVHILTQRSASQA